MLENLDDRAYLELPNNEAEKVLKCYFCDDWIYAGDDYYSLDNLDCCEDCLNLHYRRTAEQINCEAELADLECHDIN